MDAALGRSGFWSRHVSARGLRHAFENLSILLLYGAFASAHVVSFAHHPRPSCIVLAAFELLFVAFYLLRFDAKAVSTSTWDWITTMVGSFLPLLVRPVARADDAVVGEVLQASGALLVTWGLLSLNRSIGFVPANRGIRCHGAYRLVRHPLYAGYMVLQTGYLLSNPSARNLGVLGVAFACQLARVYNEERLLSADPEYAEYRRRTRWRLVPFVF